MVAAVTTSAEALITENDESFDDAWLAAVSQSTALLSGNGHEVYFQLDTAADVNTICQNTYAVTKSNHPHNAPLRGTGRK
ncbi:hypothetical protein ElyMa_004751900 [Elysia marginata]|uniref:PH domain-containing protein n=1 Tax=Elysia marginata TaxID=1093978 RepID=A0AAV4IFG3_9GAST|nr:hypothetical protein ElyMa_004751900 [Elysia marginata]